MADQPALQRVVSLPLLVLYGLGVTIGAGIYVLVGETAAQAGMFAPMSFVLAAIVMAFSAGTFAELSSRFPQSAGEAIYVDRAFGKNWLTLLTGGIVILSAIVAAATITLGGAGYVAALVDLPATVIIVTIVLLMGGIAAWGVKQSVIFAAVFTVLEIIGLLVIIAAGFYAQPDILTRLPEVIPDFGDSIALGAIFTTSIIAFFAFIGFNDLVNLVEETKNPARNMPLAILLTLVIASGLYFAVVSVAVLSLPLAELAEAKAPIGLLFESLTGASPVTITLIAVVATLNGIVIQIIMASRVLYGLGKQGRIPGFFAKINTRTKTPLQSTILVTIIILALALFFPIGSLAETTTRLILFVFSLINLSLIIRKRKATPIPAKIYTVRIWVPVGGFLTCLTMLVGPYFIS